MSVTTATLHASELASGRLTEVTRGCELAILDTPRFFECQYAALMLADLGLVPADHDANIALAGAKGLVSVVASRRSIDARFVRAVVVRSRREPASLGMILESIAQAGFSAIRSRLVWRRAYDELWDGLPLTALRRTHHQDARRELLAVVDELFPGDRWPPPWRLGPRALRFPPLEPEAGAFMTRVWQERPPRPARRIRIRAPRTSL